MTITHGRQKKFFRFCRYVFASQRYWLCQQQQPSLNTQFNKEIPMPYGVSPLLSIHPEITSVKKAQAAFDAGKDFAMPFGGYINKEDLMKLHPDLTSIQVRYGKNHTSTHILKIGE